MEKQVVFRNLLTFGCGCNIITVVQVQRFYKRRPDLLISYPKECQDGIYYADR